MQRIISKSLNTGQDIVNYVKNCRHSPRYRQLFQKLSILAKIKPINSKITYHIFKLNNSNANSDSNDQWSTAKNIFFHLE